MAAAGVGCLLLDREEYETLGLEACLLQHTQVECGLEIVAVVVHVAGELARAGAGASLEVDDQPVLFDVDVWPAFDLDIRDVVRREEAGLVDARAIHPFRHLRDGGVGDVLRQLVFGLGQEDVAVEIGGELGILPGVAAPVAGAAADEILFRLEDEGMHRRPEVEGGRLAALAELPVGQRFVEDGLYVRAADGRVGVVGFVAEVCSHLLLNP